MSMEHKAFLFDHDKFQKDLEVILVEALDSNEVDALRNFIIDNLDNLKDPYEGEPLDLEWEAMIEPKDAHQYGDFALTLYYDPQADIGLGYEWDIQDSLPDDNAFESSPVLGIPLGKNSNVFDPGKMGSYFQSPNLVQTNLASLNSIYSTKPDQEEFLQPAIDMLGEAEKEKKGLYITF
jgi:hypothetical protein